MWFLVWYSFFLSCLQRNKPFGTKMWNNSYLLASSFLAIWLTLNNLLLYGYCSFLLSSPGNISKCCWHYLSFASSALLEWSTLKWYQDSSRYDHRLLSCCHTSHLTKCSCQSPSLPCDLTWAYQHASWHYAVNHSCVVCRKWCGSLVRGSGCVNTGSLCAWWISNDLFSLGSQNFPSAYLRKYNHTIPSILAPVWSELELVTSLVKKDSGGNCCWIRSCPRIFKIILH